MDPNRKHWNEGQEILQNALRRSGEHQLAIRLFLDQHAMVHSSAMSESEL